jgi:hypothetical protein
MPICGKTVRRERFLPISQCFHCTDDVLGEAARDKLKKIRPVVTDFTHIFSELYVLSEGTAVDELSNEIYSLSKHVQFGT